MTLGAMSRSAVSPMTGRTSRLRGGTATVELAIVLPLIITLLFGTLEIGLMARSSLSLAQIGREVARAVSVGATSARVQALIGEISTGLDDQRVTATLQYRRMDPATGTWGCWTTLTDDGVHNGAQSGNQIRVVLTYRHALLTGGMLANLFNASEDNTVILNSNMVSMRE